MQPTPSDVVIVFFVSLVIILFFAWMIYLIVVSISYSETTSGQNSDAFFQVCPIGSCATNIYTGQKRCPSLSSTVAANLQDEVCNIAFGCDNPNTPYAVQSDGSAIYTGICEPGIQCPCVSQPRCPSYVTSLFSTNTGNPYQSIVGQQINFTQSNNYINPSGQQTDSTPIIVTGPPATSFCSVPINWLQVSTPGCNFTNDIINEDDIVACMGMPLGCNGFVAQPCLYGTLAFLPNSNTPVTSQNFASIPLACVRGEACPCGQVAVWNNNIGQIVCTQLS